VKQRKLYTNLFLDKDAHISYVLTSPTFNKIIWVGLLLLNCIILSVGELSATNFLPIKLDTSTVVDCDPLDPILDCDGDGTPNKTDKDPSNPCIGWTIQLKSNDCDGDGITVKNGDPDDGDVCNPIPQPDCKEEAYEEAANMDSSTEGVIANINNPCNEEVPDQSDCDGDGSPNNLDEAPFDPCVGGTIILATNDCDGDGVTVGDGDPDDHNICIPNPQEGCEEEFEEEIEEEFDEEIEFDDTSDNQHIIIDNPCPIKEGTNPVDCDNDGTLNNEDEDPLDPCIGATNQLGTNDCDGDGVTVADGDPDDFDFCTPVPNEACQDQSNGGIIGQTSVANPCPEPTECFIQVQTKAFLQGAYNEDEPTLMYDKLRLQELIPLKEPYTSLIIYEGENQPFMNFGEKEETTTTNILAKTGANAIVDWVFLELHDPNNAEKILATRSALLQRDGDVVDVDGESPVEFAVKPGKYYLAIRHRNHLGVMTKDPIAFSQIVSEKIDFTNTKTATYQLEDSRKTSAYSQRQIDDRNYLWGGNSNADRSTIYQGPGLDQTKVFYDIFVHPENIGPDGFPNYNFILRTYSISDSNLDGEVRYQGPENDVDDLQFFNIILHPENPGFFNNKIIYEQIPVAKKGN